MLELGQTAIIRCDLFPRSGVGRLKRCTILGKTLATKGISSILALDSDEEALPIIVDLPVVGLNTAVFDELEDANQIINLSRERAANLVIGGTTFVSPIGG